MKQDIVTYKVDSFIDYTGKKRMIVACALSETPGDDQYDLLVGWVDRNDRIHKDAKLCHEVYRMVTIGIAVCNPEDTFNEEVGRNIAYNKAKNIESLPRIYAPCKGVVTKELVDTFLDQQIQFFKEHPETIIVGYREAAQKYAELQTAEQEIANFSDTEKAIFQHALKGGNFSKYINLAKIYARKLKKRK